MRSFFKANRDRAQKRRSIVAPLILEKLKPLLVQPTLSFVSTDDEIDMSYVNEYLLRKNLLILPRIEGDELSLHLADGKLVRNRYGILEPSRHAPIAIPRLALVPGLAFDSANNRVGYGKGFYDRLLAKISVYSIGIAYEEQLYSSLDVESHDFPVNEVLIF